MLRVRACCRHVHSENARVRATVAALEAQGAGIASSLSQPDQETLRRAGFTACVTCTDVHEYGKILVETALGRLDVEGGSAGAILALLALHEATGLPAAREQAHAVQGD